VSLVVSTAEDARALDQEAFLRLLEPVLPSAYRLAFAMLRSQPDAEDAVQEAALKAWRHLGRFQRDRDLKPWFLTILANQCRSQLRSRWWSVVKGARTPEGAAEASFTNPEVADLRQALDRLRTNERLVLVLRYYLDLPLEEVGRILGISTKAARSRTHRALQRLRMSPEVMDDA
jgi:RNA polymerase sigma-70 factor (ECF subfamily)